MSKLLPLVYCLCPTYKRPSRLIANAIACFESQTYPASRRRLLVVDDSGGLAPQQGDNWEIISLVNRYPSLPAKYNSMVAMASECASGGLHIWPESGYLEVLEDDSDKNAPDGEVGRLVATGLLNQDMMLVRYEVGDRLALPVGFGILGASLWIMWCHLRCALRLVSGDVSDPVSAGGPVFAGGPVIFLMVGFTLLFASLPASSLTSV